MGRNNFLVKVTDIKENHLKLDVKIIREGQEEFYSAINFALQLICNWDSKYEEKLKKSPLGKEVKPENLYDQLWLMQNQTRFIKSAGINHTKNYPLHKDYPKLSDKRQQSFWKDAENLPSAIYEVEVSDKKWIEHLAVGDTWETAAYDFFADL